MSVIERSSPVPYYEQLHDHLLQQIQRGELAEGERLPGESELHRDYNLSRQTVRQALEMLESEGWAQKVLRRGYFVTSPQRAQGWLIEGPGGFLEKGIGHANSRVDTTVVSAGPGELPAEATTALRLPAGARGFVMERVRRVDGDIALFSTNYTPNEVASAIIRTPSVLKGTSSLTEALRDAGFTAAGAHRVIHALGAPEAIARHLQVPTGLPLMRIQSTSWTADGLRFDYYETWLRTDVVPLEVDATAHRNGM